jgi:O-antigen/teichoic acid export membrane protein
MSIDTPVAPSRTRLRRLPRVPMSRHRLYLAVRAAGQVLAIRVLGAGLTYGSMVLLARWLGAYEFGIYAYVQVVTMLMGIGLSFGFSSSGLRFVSTYLARDKLRRLTGFLAWSYRAVVLLSIAGTALGAGLVYAGRHVIDAWYVTPLLVGMLAVPLWTLLTQLEGTARAFGWVNLAYVPNYILRPLVLIVPVGGHALLGGAADAVTALCALIGACALAALVQGVIVWRRSRARLGDTRPAFHARHWFGVSLGFLLIDGFRMLLDNTDILLVGHFLDPHSVAIYFAVIRTSGLIGFIAFSVNAFAVPRFAEIHSTGTRADLQAFVSSVIRMMFWPSLLAALAMAVLGPVLLSLFGPDFGAGYAAMLVVLIGLVLRAATLPVEYLLNMTGHHRDTMRVYGAAALANVALCLALIPLLGILGAAIASYVAMLGGNLCLYRLVRERLGIEACVIRFGRRAATPAA